MAASCWQPLRVVTFNVGLKALHNTVSTYGSLADFLALLDADVCCFQETKHGSLGDLQWITSQATGFVSFASVNRKSAGYAGTMTVVRESLAAGAIVLHGLTGALDDPATSAQRRALCSGGDASGSSAAGARSSVSTADLELDGEGRALTVVLGCGLVLVNVYMPARGDLAKRTEFKRRFHAALRSFLRSLPAARPVLVVGDLNVSHTALDKPPASGMPQFRRKKGKVAHAPPPPPPGGGPPPPSQFVLWMNELASGAAAPFYDAFRRFFPARQNAFTCWDEKTSARKMNFGVRLDYCLASRNLPCVAAAADASEAAASAAGAGGAAARDTAESEPLMLFAAHAADASFDEGAAAAAAVAEEAVAAEEAEGGYCEATDEELCAATAAAELKSGFGSFSALASSSFSAAAAAAPHRCASASSSAAAPAAAAAPPPPLLVPCKEARLMALLSARPLHPALAPAAEAANGSSSSSSSSTGGGGGGGGSSRRRACSFAVIFSDILPDVMGSDHCPAFIDLAVDLPSEPPLTPGPGAAAVRAPPHPASLAALCGGRQSLLPFRAANPHAALSAASGGGGGGGGAKRARIERSDESGGAAREGGSSGDPPGRDDLASSEAAAFPTLRVGVGDAVDSRSGGCASSGGSVIVIDGDGDDDASSAGAAAAHAPPPAKRQSKLSFAVIAPAAVPPIGPLHGGGSSGGSGDGSGSSAGASSAAAGSADRCAPAPTGRASPGARGGGGVDAFARLMRAPPPPPQCLCKRAAVERRSGVVGPNNGRFFFSCDGPEGAPGTPGARCSFFRWK